MKKKIILFSLIASLIIGMTACNNENSVQEITEQITSISETVTEKKTKTESQSETSTEKTETAETIDQSETSLTVNNETQITVKAENTMAAVTAEISEEITSENESEEFSFENLTITIGDNEYKTPVYFRVLNLDGWELVSVDLSEEKILNRKKILFGYLLKDGVKSDFITIMVLSEDDIISGDDKVIHFSFDTTERWSVGKIKKGMSRDEVNSIYSNFTTEGQSNLYKNDDDEIMYISYDKFDKVSSIAIKGI